jgi:hypothetical protein
VCCPSLRKRCGGQSLLSNFGERTQKPLFQIECSRARIPDYIGFLRAAGWGTFHLNRSRRGDTLVESSAALASAVESLKQKCYRRLILAGQSFGALNTAVGSVPSRGSALLRPIGRPVP